MEVTQWELRILAVRDPGDGPTWMSSGRVPLELRLNLRNPKSQGVQAELMLVTEDGDASVTFKGYAAATKKLVIPSPSHTWSRPKLRVTLFSLVLLAGETGDVSCNFRQPLEFFERYRSQLLFLTPRRLQWAKLGPGVCSGELPSSMQIGLFAASDHGESAPKQVFPARVEPWPYTNPATTFTTAVPTDSSEVRIDFNQSALPALQELFLLGFPGAALGSLLALSLPWGGLRNRSWGCLLASLVGAALAWSINWALCQHFGWPDLSYRSDSGTWATVFGYCTRAASPVVSGLAVFFVWPLFKRSVSDVTRDPQADLVLESDS